MKAQNSFALSIIFCTAGLWGSGWAEAQQAPRVGRGAAAKYLSKEPEEVRPAPVKGDSMLMILVGPYIDSVAYAWKGSHKRTKVGGSSYGVTYLFDRWSSIDVNFRADFSEFKIDDDKYLKLSLMPLWTFPMMDTHFPLYFGLGAGLGIFFKQVEDESNLSFDYQLIAGVRVPNLIESTGFVLEFGLKNHLHLLSDGQFNGTHLNVGAIFTF